MPEKSLVFKEILFFQCYLCGVVAQLSRVSFASATSDAYILVTQLDLEFHHPQTGNHTAYFYFAMALGRRK